MGISINVKNALESSSMIRKMFEEGLQLKKQHGEDKVFDFSLGNPDIDPPPEFHNIFVDLANKDEKGSHSYMPNAGYPFVREALAKKVSREQNVNIESSDIIMSAGAAGGLNAVFKTICNTGDEVIVNSPYFVEYRAYIANHGAKHVEVNTKDDFDLDIDAIKAALNEKTAAVIINSPNNPTGKVYSEDVLSSLAAILLEHGEKTGRQVFLVSDEPYREIAYNCEVPPVLSSYINSIVVSSYSKSLSLPGERIGFIAVNPKIKEKEDLVNGIIYCTRVLGFVNAPAIMQRIVARLTEVSVDVSIYEKRRDVFMKVLDEAGIEYAVPQGAFYLFCKIPVSKASGKACDKEFSGHLKKHLILGVPGSGFGKPGYIRFAYCVDEKIIASSLSAFKKAVESW